MINSMQGRWRWTVDIHLWSIWWLFNHTIIQPLARAAVSKFWPFELVSCFWVPFLFAWQELTEALDQIMSWYPIFYANAEWESFLLWRITLFCILHSLNRQQLEKRKKTHSNKLSPGPLSYLKYAAVLRLTLSFPMWSHVSKCYSSILTCTFIADYYYLFIFCQNRVAEWSFLLESMGASSIRHLRYLLHASYLLLSGHY